MPAVSTRSSKKATAAVPAKKAKTEEVEEEAIHEVEEVVVAKKARAKATAKSASAKNPKKRAREEESSSEEDEEVSSPVPAKASTSRASVTKKSSGKKSTAAKKSATAPSDSEEGEDSSFEDAPAKKASSKKAGAKKSSFGAKKASKVQDDEDASGSEDSKDDEEPTLKEVPTNFAEPKLSAGELKIVSWNVASYRAALKKGLLEYLKGEDADIVCLQETKIATELNTQKHGYHAYFFGCKAKPGLHGTGLLSKVKPISVDMVSTLDAEGRVLVAEYDTFYLINTYVPNSGMKLERLPYRIKWDQGLHDMLLKLEKTKPIIWTGDLNVAKHPIDLANPAGNKRTAGFTEQERNSFLTFTEGNNIIDTYRTRHPEEKDCYTFWTYKRNSRAKNIGWRMDYFMVSASLDASVTQSYRRNHILGSDHCPIVIHLRK